MSKRFPVIDWENAEELTKIWGKKDFLSKVNAADCIKDIISGCYLMQLQATIAAKALMRQKKIKPLIKKLTKTEKKACEDFATKLRETELEEWVKESDSDDSKERWKKDGISVPSHYKKYTVEDRKILMQLPDRQNEKNKSYDGGQRMQKGLI